MCHKETFDKLGENSQHVLDEAVRILLKIAENILKNPSNLKLRTLQKSNSKVYDKILSIKGGTDCLKLMGFEENNSSFTLPTSVYLSSLEKFQNAIISWKKSDDTKKVTLKESKETSHGHSSNGNTSRPIKRIILPPLVLIYSNPFLRRIETCFHHVLQYENVELQQRAKNYLPLALLEENAQKRLRVVQESVKKDNLDDPNISIQDALILELLAWFKEEFFEWVDSPECSNCKGKTTFSHMSTDPNLLVYTDRVELHRCNTCHQFTPFPRYKDLNILLETRKGRCGEWANTFTLFCRAMGWDARYVVDEGDHVWTEVYSFTQKRWLHCDPCENICDRPLIYESGWQKKKSYVIAYSAEEVQDVTWRYSSYHTEVLKRRKNCSEMELSDALFKLRTNRQKDLSNARKKFLTRRLLSELVEFLTEKKPVDDDQKGRSSGSAVWRLARGEIQEKIEESMYIWKIYDSEIINNTVTIRYSSSLDKYHYISGNMSIREIDKWYKGVYKHGGIFRKEEKDWKVVYLARKEGEQDGNVSWKYELESLEKVIDTISVNFRYATFENGTVEVKICSENSCVLLQNNEEMITFNDFSGSKSVTISASLRGGKGSVAWQHAQLFRQSVNNNEFPFTLVLTFK